MKKGMNNNSNYIRNDSEWLLLIHELEEMLCGGGGRGEWPARGSESGSDSDGQGGGRSIEDAARAKLREALVAKRADLSEFCSSSATSPPSQQQLTENRNNNHIENDNNGAGALDERISTLQKRFKGRVVPIAILDKDYAKVICDRTASSSSSPFTSKKDHDLACDATTTTVTSRVVLLSDATLEKQKQKHPEVGLDEYLALQEVLDRGRAIREIRAQHRDKHLLVFFLKRKKKQPQPQSQQPSITTTTTTSTSEYEAVKAVIKATARGDECYLLSLFCVPVERAEAERVRGKHVGRESRKYSMEAMSFL